MIRKLKSGSYRLYSRKTDARTGKRRNLGTFATRAAGRAARARGPVLQAPRVTVRATTAAGRDLPARRKRVLELAKSELRNAFGRDGRPS